MKLKLIAAVALLAAGFGASFALADSGPGKGRRGGHDSGATETTSTAVTTSTEPRRGRGHEPNVGEGCRPAVSLILEGTLLTVGDGSLDLHVAQANAHARRLVGQDVTVLVVEATKIRRDGPAALADLAQGDRLVVQVRACKAADLAGATLTARRIGAHPAEATHEDAGDGPTTTTTTTSSG